MKVNNLILRIDFVNCGDLVRTVSCWERECLEFDLVGIGERGGFPQLKIKSQAVPQFLKDLFEGEIIESPQETLEKMRVDVNPIGR